jgi:hypothetical protein
MEIVLSVKEPAAFKIIINGGLVMSSSTAVIFAWPAELGIIGWQ